LATNGPGDSEGVFARLYYADGTARTGEFRVNAGTTNPQRGAVVAMNAGGTFAVAWSTADPSLGTSSVVARLFNPSGTALSGDLAVTAARSNQSFGPTGMGMDDTGNFLVLYHGGKKSGPYWTWGQIYFQRYNSSGQTLGGAIQVAASNLANGSSSVGMAADGRFAVAWNDASSIHVQRYSASAKPTGAQITPAVNYGNPSQAMNAAGSFVVAESPYNVPSGNAQIFNADGTPHTGAFVFSTPSGPPTAGIFTQTSAVGPYTGFGPSLSMDSSGNVIAAWSDTANVKARRFSSTGVAQEDVFVVSAAVGGLRSVPSVSMTGSGNFVVAWSGPGVGDSDGVFAQRFTAPGAALRATGGVAPAQAPARPLTAGAVRPLLAEAIARWTAAGVPAGSLTAANAVNVQVVNLGGPYLGFASGRTIWLDANAAGWGWFVDKTPWSDSEFTTPGDQGEQGRMDLLTVLLHEMGHVLGLGHEDEGVMQETLPAGTRRLPAADEASTAGTPARPLAGGPASTPGAVRFPSAPHALDRYFASRADWDALAVALSLALDPRRKS
jgi:hypothetical protein